jgi:hypothetical protein
MMHVTRHALNRWKERVNASATDVEAREAIEHIMLHGKATRQRPHRKWGIRIYHVEDRDAAGVIVVCHHEPSDRFVALTVVSEGEGEDHELA